MEKCEGGYFLILPEEILSTISKWRGIFRKRLLYLSWVILSMLLACCMTLILPIAISRRRTYCCRIRGPSLLILDLLRKWGRKMSGKLVLELAPFFTWLLNSFSRKNLTIASSVTSGALVLYFTMYLIG
jgi:hypothetical protein